MEILLSIYKIWISLQKYPAVSIESESGSPELAYRSNSQSAVHKHGDIIESTTFRLK